MHSTMLMWVFAGLTVALTALIVGMFYVLTLSRALLKCSPQLRTMRPELVWLLLIPVVNLVWQFFVVMALSASLGNEFRARGMANAPQEPGKQVGLAMCLCSIAGFIPVVRVMAGLAGLAGFVLWMVYWVKIAEFSRMLNASEEMWFPMGGAPPGGMMPRV